MARPLEQAVAAIVFTFQEYAGRYGDKYKICQSELKELLQKELPTWTPVRTLTPLPVSGWDLVHSAKSGLGPNTSMGQQQGGAGLWEQGHKEVSRHSCMTLNQIESTQGSSHPYCPVNNSSRLSKARSEGSANERWSRAGKGMRLARCVGRNGHCPPVGCSSWFPDPTLHPFCRVSSGSATTTNS